MPVKKKHYRVARFDITKTITTIEMEKFLNENEDDYIHSEIKEGKILFLIMSVPRRRSIRRLTTRKPTKKKAPKKSPAKKTKS